MSLPPPSWSRNCSATVRPESATRRRAPGGSFIWPNTRVACDCSTAFMSTSSRFHSPFAMFSLNLSPYLITPLSIISRSKSLPSRVRSPTPVNTEKPLCPRAILWISSIISTVLPTPAPPNKPILPPLENGSIRSITLIPVYKISCEIERSAKEGAGW